MKKQSIGEHGEAQVKVDRGRIPTNTAKSITTATVKQAAKDELASLLSKILEMELKKRMALCFTK